MSPLNEPQPEPSQSDELVAYLDGELAPEECRAVEDRLANDAAYRQQLHDLDQAWEALDALPTSTVDDAFARTTIELACVAAQEDVSQRKSIVAAANRNRRRWWIAGAVAAGVMGFLMVRALAVHRNNAQLADLPVIQQADVLALVDSIDFLKQLSKAVKPDEFVRDQAAFATALTDFQQASSPTLSERRRWFNSLSAEQKLNLADSARAFANANTRPEERQERDRQRRLVEDLNDDSELQRTLVAYGQWLSGLSAGRRDQLREELRKLSATSAKVAAIQRYVRQEAGQLQHLSAEDRIALRSEIVKLAEEKSKELQRRFPPDSRRRPGPGPEESQIRPALMALGAVLRNQPEREAAVERLVGALSRTAQEHWRGLPSNRERQSQFFQWLRDLRATGNDEELEQFFASDKVPPDERQRLLEMPRDEMKDRLERMYLRSEFGFDWPEFVEGRRGPGFGDPGRPGGRGNGPWRFAPPPGSPGGPRFGPGEGPGPDGPPRDGDFRRVPPDDGPGGPPQDGPPPRRPPGPPPKPPVEEA